MFILSINTMLVVYVIFMAVILLLVLFIVIGKAIERKKVQKSAMAKEEQSQEGISGAGKAAIAMALHLYYGVHDNESDVITLKNIQSRYSPWSSKIYGIQ